MFLTFFGCWCIAFSFSGIESQEIQDSFNSGYDSRFSNSWNPNSGFSINNNRYIGNIKNTEPNFFSSNGSPKENKFFSTGSEKNFQWGHEAATNTDKTSDWNFQKPNKANSAKESNSFNNRPNKKKLSSIMNLPNSSKWNPNSNSFTSDSNKESNSDFSTWGYNSAKSPSDQINKKLEGWNSKDISKNKSNEIDGFSESDYEDNSANSFWSSSKNEKTKPTFSSYHNSDSRESNLQKNKKNFGNSIWETNSNKKPHKVSESNIWKNNNYSQPGREKISNSNLSVLDTFILDEMDKNDWYFGKETNYPKPPFRSTLNIDVSELWNFDKNKKTNPNSRGNRNNAKINNNNNNRRDRQIERPIERVDGIHCECVNVNLCEEEDMIITQHDVKFEFRPFKEFTCEHLTEVCCINPKIKRGRENFQEEKEQLKCGQSQVKESQFEDFRDKIAEPGEFPWNLRLEHAEINCSASLIHHKMALTAAHCVTSAQPQELILKAGLWNSNNEPHQNRRIIKIIQHPDYDNRNPRNDIALLILETPFKLTDNVNTICLPKTNDKWDSNQCVVAGWRSEEIRGQYSDVLVKELVNFLPQTECQTMMLVTDLWRNYILHDSFICGIGKTPRKSCISDEGGFVICPSKDRPRTYLQIGIISMEINCDNFGRPGIFTNVLKFLDWINQNYFDLDLFDEVD